MVLRWDISIVKLDFHHEIISFLPDGFRELLNDKLANERLLQLALLALWPALVLVQPRVAAAKLGGEGVHGMEVLLRPRAAVFVVFVDAAAAAAAAAVGVYVFFIFCLVAVSRPPRS